MGNGLASKLIYYWIFVLGGLSISYVLKLVSEGTDFIIMLVALTLIYWGIEFMKLKRNQRKGNQPEPSKRRNNGSRNKR